ncbi:MAG: methyltransferase domain-containing protein [Anaerolineales bacterium]|nr:methyltransferase domain-containing protein [Anaerolineales bacterium]
MPSRVGHFNLLAPLYDRVITAPDPSALKRAADLPVEGRLLDAGGGTGRIARLLSGFAGQIVLADASHNMLLQARLLDLDGAVSYTQSLPFPSGAFERIIAVDSYHHLSHQKESLKEFCRVLVPGGRLVIEEPDITLFPVKVLALAEKLALMQSHFDTAETIAGTLQKLGARVQIEREGHNVWVIADKPPA